MGNGLGYGALRSMKITEELLKNDLFVLNHGGQEAIFLFMEMSRRYHESGGADAVKNWITLAAPALPEAERGEVMVLLMYGYLFMHYEIAQRETIKAEHRPSLH